MKNCLMLLVSLSIMSSAFASGLGDTYNEMAVNGQVTPTLKLESGNISIKVGDVKSASGVECVVAMSIDSRSGSAMQCNLAHQTPQKVKASSQGSVQMVVGNNNVTMMDIVSPDGVPCIIGLNSDSRGVSSLQCDFTKKIIR